MFEIDKKEFGEFIAAQRKSKGYTQKELAAKLFVTDKAVSKWERALSMPDITLLVPLAEALDVTVTELLYGRRLENADIGKEEVELIVKKAINFSEEIPRRKISRNNILIFGMCVLVSFFEFLTGMWCIDRYGFGNIFNRSSGVLVFEILGLVFGVYAWFIMKDRLPSYYDENKINIVSDGFFSMNIPGVGFDNANWPHIINVLRIWSLTVLIITPIVCIILSMVPDNFVVIMVIQQAGLIAGLASLFVPLYVVGRKYKMS